MEALIVAGIFFGALAISGLKYYHQTRGGGLGGSLPALFEGRVPVEDILLDLRAEARKLGYSTIEVEIDWNRFLQATDTSNSSALAEGFHVLITACSEQIPPFLTLPAAWAETLLFELPEDERLLVKDSVDFRGTRVAGGEVRLLQELPPSSGGWVAKTKGQELRDELEEALHRVVSTAGALCKLTEIAPRWLAQTARIFEGTTVGGERLSTLVQHYPRHAATAEACARALEDGGATQQLVAALHLGHGARLRDLYFAEPPDKIPEALFLRVLERLYAGAPVDQAEATLRHALRHPSAEVLTRALRWLRVLGRPAAAAELGTIAGQAPTSAALRAIIHELAESGDPDADEVLLSILERGLSEDEPRFDDCERMVMALHRVGTTRAVPLLRALGDEDEGELPDLDFVPARVPDSLRLEARAAVEAIQSRIDPRQRGGLALAQPEPGGALAIAQEGGGLALAGPGGELAVERDEAKKADE